MSVTENHLAGFHERSYVGSCALCRRRESQHLQGRTLFEPKSSPPPPLRSGAETLLARFERFFAKHPGIWERFESIALDRMQRGRRVGAKEVWEQLRTQDETQAGGERDEGFRLPNDFPPYFARVFLAKFPTAWKQLQVRRIQGDETEIRETLGRCLDRIGVAWEHCRCEMPTLLNTDSAAIALCAHCRRKRG